MHIATFMHFVHWKNSVNFADFWNNNLISSNTYCHEDSIRY